MARTPTPMPTYTPANTTMYDLDTEALIATLGAPRNLAERIQLGLLELEAKNWRECQQLATRSQDDYSLKRLYEDRADGCERCARMAAYCILLQREAVNA